MPPTCLYLLFPAADIVCLGKTTVARIWGEFLAKAGAIPGSEFKETSGAKLASDGIKGCEKLLEAIKGAGGGVLFIDEAYQLTSGSHANGKAVLDFLLAEVENLRGKVVFVVAGYDKDMESFFAHNPGLPSRFPTTFKFQDYTDNELLEIFQLQVIKQYKGMVQLEGGMDGLYARIVARRVGRGRGRPGFGNARAVENGFGVIRKRQAKNIRRAKKSGASFDEKILTKLDLIGPEPKSAFDECPAWKKLNQMVGLDKVKEELGAFREAVITNYERELDEEPLIDFSLNRVFLGPPGTGKTTVAKLYGEILAHIGLLSNGEVVVKNPSDFIGPHMGSSEDQTKGILASSMGKVLVIDEAYGLYPGGDGSWDPYRVAVIDTIVAKVQSVPGDDQCVLLLGYEEQMQQMFQKVNPGLSRRFPMSSAFNFEEFDDDALSKILDVKLKAIGFQANGVAKSAAMDVLRRARNRANFGNAGEIDILLDRAKSSNQKRRANGQTKSRGLEAIDFDADYDRATRDTDVKALFDGDIGREKVIELLEDLQNRVKELKSIDMDPKDEIPFSFLFRGPPGTGKTTTARKMGKVYYDMGFLATAEVIECSASDMIGQYIGHTGPKVRQLMDKVLGKVLFIDEAYRLTVGHFAQEAVDELVDCVTKTKYHGKLIIILAGYDHDINRLLSVNPGLSSRFPDSIDFAALGIDECLQLLTQSVGDRKKKIEDKGKKTLDISCLEHPSGDFKAQVLGLFRRMSQVEGWASGRDVKEISKSVFRSIKLSDAQPTLDAQDVLMAMRKFLNERTSRASSSQNRKPLSKPSQPQASDPTSNTGPPPPNVQTSSNTKTDASRNMEKQSQDDVSDKASSDSAPEDATVIELGNAANTPEISSDDDSDSYSDCVTHQFVAPRDPSVSDEDWEQLEKDKAAEVKRDEDYRKLKQARKRASEEIRQKIVKQLLDEENRRKKEAAIRKKLEDLGLCPMGYAWIRQAGGYRCAGGSHALSDAQIGSFTQ